MCFAGKVCWSSLPLVGVREPSCSTLPRDRLLHEGAGEGRRRIIFDLETISEHEEALRGSTGVAVFLLSPLPAEALAGRITEQTLTQSDFKYVRS